MHPLIELGVRQFLYIPLECFSDDFHKELSLCRSQAQHREKKVSKSDFLLVVSQDCDIDSNSFQYIELLVFRKAKAKESKKSSSIEFARNVHKIFIRDKEDFIFKKEESSLVSKELFINELNSIKEKEGQVDFLSFDNRNSKTILLSWLVNYYARRPLPDGFNRTLFDNYIKNPEGHPLQLFLLKYFEEIADIHAFISPLDDECAESYDVTLTALLHDSCSAEKAEAIEEELKKIIDEIHGEENNLNMMQSIGQSFHDDALMDYVVFPSDFTKKDELNTRRLLLDFLCWMPKGDEP